MCQKTYTDEAIREMQQIAADCPPYSYGDAPWWWGRGKDAAAQAATDAIALSVRVGARLRELAGPHGDTLTLRTSIVKLFEDESERVEAIRLLDLAARNRRRAIEKSTNYLERHLEPDTRDGGAGSASATESGAVAELA